jgi:hypothetical protein
MALLLQAADVKHSRIEIDRGPAPDRRAFSARAGSDTASSYIRRGKGVPPVADHGQPHVKQILPFPSGSSQIPSQQSASVLHGLPGGGSGSSILMAATQLDERQIDGAKMGNAGSNEVHRPEQQFAGTVHVCPALEQATGWQTPSPQTLEQH